jgi:MoaD family protein
MAVEIKLPTVLRTHVEGQPSVTADGATIGEAFADLVARYPGLRANLIGDDGDLHKFVNVYVNDDDIRYLDRLDTKIADGDTISILPAVAGGSGLPAVAGGSGLPAVAGGSGLPAVAGGAA